MTSVTPNPKSSANFFTVTSDGILTFTFSFSVSVISFLRFLSILSVILRLFSRIIPRVRSFDRLLLFIGQWILHRFSFFYRLGINPVSLPRVKGRDYHAGILSVKKRYGKTLVPAQVLERIEADNANFVN